MKTAVKKASLDVGKFIKIRAGSFLMGSPENETGRYDNEKQHKVTLTGDFELGETPVTQAQYEAVMGANPSYFKNPNAPVETVSWDDAQEFIKKLNESQSEYVYRLPTEAEWEYAARAGTTDAHAFPKKDIEHYAWFHGNSDIKTHPVKQKLPNPWGLYDMFGNVWEWCNDFYGSY